MLLLIFSYFALLSFIFLSLYKAVQYARMPVHGRLDLYPIPKEKGKAEYGGSYMEESGWWRKKHEISFAGELKEMLQEMLFIKRLFEHQKSLWWLSYALHLGIYLLIGWTILIFTGAGFELVGVAVPSSGGLARLIYYLTILTGAAGAVLTAFGSAALLFKRLVMPSFKKYTSAQEYFNLLFIFSTVVSGINVWQQDVGFNYGREMARSLLTFQPIQADAALTVHIILLGLLLIYIPLTKMSHYAGKYFTFHKVLWDNAPNLPGSKVEKKIQEGSQFKPKITWSAPHWQTTDEKK
ncbi:MAG: respiratory nitrate reductase subunit gamma [Thermoanaerobacteraceae bacterium]|nr:respiratory nitrate reductase subunit gamma [Thermoanaerobacteraceae bacterium]